MREEGEASGEGVKIFCKGFDKGEHCGLRSNYNIRADMDLLAKDKSLEISMSCFPCCYVGCV